MKGTPDDPIWIGTSFRTSSTAMPSASAAALRVIVVPVNVGSGCSIWTKPSRMVTPMTPTPSSSRVDPSFPSRST